MEKENEVFEMVATTILECMEEALCVVARNGKSRTVASIVELLAFYTIAKTPEQIRQAEKEFAARKEPTA